MDQQSDTPNDNPFKPEEEASFNESATESTVASVPVEQPAEPVVNEPAQPFAPSPFTAAAPVAVVAPVASSAQDAPVTSTEPASAPSPAKKKKWIPLAIAGGALVLLGGGASAYYFGVYQNPDNVLYDAFSHIETAKAMQASGSVNFDMPVMNGVKLKSIDYSGNFENNPSGTMNISTKLTIQGADLTVGGKGMFMDNGDLYFQLNGLVDAFKAYTQAMGMSDSDIPAGFYTNLGDVEDQWVKVTMEDMNKASEDAAKGYKCTLDAYKKHKDDNAKPVLEAYKKHAFLTKKEDLGVKDGRIGYKLAIDTVKAKEFAESIKDTELAKDLNACDSTVEEDVTNEMDTSSAADVTTNVWIDQWSHELRRVEYNGSFGENTSKVTYNGNVDMGYDSSVKTSAPSGAISIDEFGKRIETITNEIYGASEIEAESLSDSL